MGRTRNTVWAYWELEVAPPSWTDLYQRPVENQGKHGDEENYSHIVQISRPAGTFMTDNADLTTLSQVIGHGKINVSKGITLMFVQVSDS